MTETPTQTLARTPLYALHVELGAKLVPFAGYEMPVQYKDGILTEHLHTRAAAGLFDVSHMGQMTVMGIDPAKAAERLVPGDLLALAPGRTRYTMLTTADGGIYDDLMITRREHDLFVVFNAACKEQDIGLIRAGLPDCFVNVLTDRALLALQGPEAARVMARHAPLSVGLGFMSGALMPVAGFECYVTRSGYTGEDGFEISVAAADAEALARKLLAEPEVKPIGLGARDSLRLEAGLCLYGHDIDQTTNPIEAGLAWSISKRRRTEGGFPGAALVQAELANGPKRRRVGIKPDGRAPAREGTDIKSADGRVIGKVTSGGFGPSINGPVAMGYVDAAHAAVGTPVLLSVRGKDLPAAVAALPFTPHRYAR